MAVVEEVHTPIKVIDVDTHLTEPHDLWTSRAPRAFRDRVPQVRQVDNWVPEGLDRGSGDGAVVWTFDGVVLGRARAASVVRKDGSKAATSRELFSMTIDDSHPGASQITPRLELMDQLGIWAQIVYPNAIGFGGQRFAEVKDLELRELTVRIWNDAMAEMQEESGNRLFPMGLLPWWDLQASIAEIDRIKSLGLRGFITNADPQSHGLADLGDRFWDPLWEAVADSGLPLNFHIGASFHQATYSGDSPWPTQSDDIKLALGSSMLYLGNARVLGNFIYSGVLERHPTLKIVSVESGIGWIPFFLEALDYQLEETAPSALEYLSMKPSEYFKRQIYSCFWFESSQLVSQIELLGVDNCMFETDFPHPTCLYPDGLERVKRALAGVSDTFRNKVLSENAARLYSLPL
jgi:uncharacterized protein